jgi:hypothetical protein
MVPRAIPDLRQIVGFLLNFGQIRPARRKSWSLCESHGGPNGADCRSRSWSSHAAAALVVYGGLG